MELLTKITKYLNENEPNYRFTSKTRIGLNINNIKISLEDIHKLNDYIQSVKNFEHAQKDEGLKVLFQLGMSVLKQSSIRAALDINYKED